nr:hypothetical protein [Tanacetum cinerariifolium]
MHKAFPLPGECSHWQYKFPLPVEGVPTARRIEIPLPAVCTAMMKKLPVKENWQTSVKPIEHTTQAKNLQKDIPKSRGHKHSWTSKACFVCKSLNHLIKDSDYYKKKMVQKLIWNHAMRVNHQNSSRMTHPHSKKHVVPTTVLTRSRLVPLNAARPVTTVVPQTNVKHQRPAKHVVNKLHSPIRSLINHIPAPKISNFHQKVTTVKTKKIQVSHGLGPQKTLSFLFDVHGNPQQALKDKGVIDSGCSRNMTRNISYLSACKEINRGYVAFGGNPKGGKITDKGKIRTCKLDFDDVYFVKEIKFNLLSVSQMCDKKNSVLFTDTKCVVLSFDFKLPDENHATLDESNLWHKRLSHINSETMNKLVKGNLVRGLPLKVFENNHTCVACKKGKQHRASWNRPTWLFDIDTLTQSMNYQLIVARNQPNHNADPQNTDVDAVFDEKENETEVHVSPSNFSSNSTNRVNAASVPVTAVGPNSTNSTNSFNVTSPSNNALSPTFEIGGKSSFVDPSQYPNDPDMPAFEEIVNSDDDEDIGVEADFSNLETSITVSRIPTIRVHKDHPVTQIIGYLTSAPQTRSMTRMVKEQGGLNQIKAMQEELLQFKMQKVWVLVDLPKGKRAIGSKWVFRNKTDERGIVIRNNARLVAQGHTQEEGIDYEEVFTPVLWIKNIRFKDPDYPDKVYKVVKALYGLYQAPRAWYETLANYLLENRFQRGKIDQTLFIKKQEGAIFLVQVYVDDIIFGSTNKELCKAFEKLMKDKFQMSSIGELTLAKYLISLTLKKSIEDMLHLVKFKKWVLVTKPHNKTPYELLLGRTPSIVSMRPFGCPMTILNTLDPLRKFDRKDDEGFLAGPTLLFDIDTLTQSMNYQPVVARNQPNHNVGIKENLNAGVRDLSDEFKEFSVNSTNRVNAASTPVTAVEPNSTNSTNSFSVAGPSNTVVSLNFEIGRKSSFVDVS